MIMAQAPLQPFPLENATALIAYNTRARRYILRVKADGILHVTIPRGGTRAEAIAFAERNRDWILRQRQQRLSQMDASRDWHPGTEIQFRGLPALISCESIIGGQIVSFADQRLNMSLDCKDLRPFIETHLWHLAKVEITEHVFRLARHHQTPLHRVSIRNQRSRWGSSSSNGTVSLNWRLIQMPPTVRDYIIIHELAHFRHMNHAAAFWRLVEDMDPDYRESERWLRLHGRSLR